MYRSPSVSGRKKRQWRKEEHWLEWLCLGGLWLAALLLFCSGLGKFPLLDGEEATLAQVAKEIIQFPQTQPSLLQNFSDLFNGYQTLSEFRGRFTGNSPWIFPRLWEKPYYSHSFLLPDLMAIAYKWGGIHEWTTRLPVALLTAFSVPLFYKASKELLINRLTAVLSSLVYLTLFPVVYWGRLGTVNGVVLFFTVLLMYGVLRSRRDLRASLFVGLALMGFFLTQPLLGLLLTVTIIGFWAWDTPRLLQSPTIGIGILLGLVPAIIWYGLQWQHYGPLIFSKIFFPAEWTNQQQWFRLVAFYGFKLLQYSFPWLIFAIYGGQITWKSREWSWAKFILSWVVGYSFLLLLMPGYGEIALIPLSPFLALTSAIALFKIRNFNVEDPYPKTLRLALWGLGLITVLFTLGLGLNWPIHLLSSPEYPFALLILVFLSFTLIMTANLMDQHRAEFIPILIWGIYISFLLAVNTPFWLRGFSGEYPVKSVANLIQKNVPKNHLVYTSFPQEKSSLNFYSNHQIIPDSKKDLLNYWKTNKSPYLLIDTKTLNKLEKSSVKLLGKSVSDWHLITKKNSSQTN